MARLVRATYRRAVPEYVAWTSRAMTGQSVSLNAGWHDTLALETEADATTIRRETARFLEASVFRASLAIVCLGALLTSAVAAPRSPEGKEQWFLVVRENTGLEFGPFESREACRQGYQQRYRAAEISWRRAIGSYEQISAEWTDPLDEVMKGLVIRAYQQMQATGAIAQAYREASDCEARRPAPRDVGGRARPGRDTGATHAGTPLAPL